MADDGSAQFTQQSPIKTTHSKFRRSMMETAVCRTSYRLLSNAVWPLPKFRFEEKWDGYVMSFQEVSGLDVEADQLTIATAIVRHSRQSKCRALKSTETSL